MMPRLASVAIAIAAVLSSVSAAEDKYTVTTVYDDTTCGSPIVVAASKDVGTCKALTCTASSTIQCVDDYSAAVSSIFGKSPYVLIEAFSDEKCSTLAAATAIIADGKCHGTQAMSYKVAINADKSVTYGSYMSKDCSGPSTVDTNVTVADVTGGKCVANSKYTTHSGGSGNSTAAGSKAKGSDGSKAKAAKESDGSKAKSATGPSPTPKASSTAAVRLSWAVSAGVAIALVISA